MKRFSEQFYTKAQTVKLKKSEQAVLRDRIITYMEYHPLPSELRLNQTTTQTTASARRSPAAQIEPFTVVFVPFARYMKLFGVMAVLLLVLLPVVSERAVPGDTLYAVKVRFNEEIRSKLILDPYQKVEWETVRLNRRLAEAKLLADAGLLTAEAEAEVAAAVREHVDKAEAEISTLSTYDEDEAALAAITLDSTLAIQAETLSQQANQADDFAGDGKLEGGSTLIAAAVDDSIAERLVNSTTTLPALPKLKARVEQATTRIAELQQTLATQVTPDTEAEVSRRIEDIERAVSEALNLPDQMEAQLALVDLLAKSQKLIIYMTDLQVREVVVIETIVPVVLTEAEKRADMSTRRFDIESILETIATTEVTDQEVVEKLDTIISQINTMLTQLETLSDYDSYVTASDAALQLGHDALKLVDQYRTPESTVLDSGAATSTSSVASTTTTTDETVATGT